MKRGQKTSAEKVVLKLRQIEVQMAQGKSLAFAQLRRRRSPSKAPGRAAQRRGLLHASGGQGRDRGLAQALQHGPAPLIARLRPARTRGSALAGCATQTSSAGHPGRGAPTCHALTLDPDHPMGAGQRS